MKDCDRSGMACNNRVHNRVITRFLAPCISSNNSLEMLVNPFQRIVPFREDRDTGQQSCEDYRAQVKFKSRRSSGPALIQALESKTRNLRRASRSRVGCIPTKYAALVIISRFCNRFATGIMQFNDDPF